MPQSDSEFPDTRASLLLQFHAGVDHDAWQEFVNAFRIEQIDVAAGELISMGTVWTMASVTSCILTGPECWGEIARTADNSDPNRSQEK